MIASMGETKELEDAMQLPIVGVAPVVRSHAEIFRDIFANRCQFVTAQAAGGARSVMQAGMKGVPISAKCRESSTRWLFLRAVER